MSSFDEKAPAVTFTDFVRVLRSQLLFLVSMALFGVAAAAGITSQMPTVYASSASGFVSVGGAAKSASDGLAQQALGGSKADSYLPFVTSRSVAEIAIKNANLKGSPAEVAASVSGRVLPNTTVLDVSARSSSAEQAQQTADAVLRATAEYANEIEQENLGQATATLVRLIPVDNALPGVKIAPRPTLNLLVGLFVGLGVALAVVFARRQFDTRMRSVTDVEEQVGSSVLGVVPRMPGLRADKGQGVLTDLGSNVEPFRQIRTNLRFVGVDRPPRSLVITSANASEGKSTVSATLAAVMGEAGHRVLLIDCDMRRPTLNNAYGLPNTVGLSHILSGQIDVTEAITETDRPNVSMISAGRIPPNPSELLGSQRMETLLETLSQDYLVIMDAPPILPVTDAGVLAAMADGAIFVFAVGRTHKEQAKYATKLMEQVGGKVLGVVLNLAPRKAVGDVVYGQGYGGTYTSDYYTQEKYIPRRGRIRNNA